MSKPPPHTHQNVYSISYIYIQHFSSQKLWVPKDVSCSNLLQQDSNKVGIFFSYQFVASSQHRQVRDLVWRTAALSESNSMLVIGARGSGKTMVCVCWENRIADNKTKGFFVSGTYRRTTNIRVCSFLRVLHAHNERSHCLTRCIIKAFHCNVAMDCKYSADDVYADVAEEWCSWLV